VLISNAMTVKMADAKNKSKIPKLKNIYEGEFACPQLKLL
jgi:uncharacterized protein YihD (DUF1040 family)